MYIEKSEHKYGDDKFSLKTTNSIPSNRALALKPHCAVFQCLPPSTRSKPSWRPTAQISSTCFWTLSTWNHRVAQKSCFFHSALSLEESTLFSVSRSRLFILLVLCSLCEYTTFCLYFFFFMGIWAIYRFWLLQRALIWYKTFSWTYVCIY